MRRLEEDHAPLGDFRWVIQLRRVLKATPGSQSRRLQHGTQRTHITQLFDYQYRLDQFAGGLLAKHWGNQVLALRYYIPLESLDSPLIPALPSRAHGGVSRRSERPQRFLLVPGALPIRHPAPIAPSPAGAALPDPAFASCRALREMRRSCRLPSLTPCVEDRCRASPDCRQPRILESARLSAAPAPPRTDDSAAESPRRQAVLGSETPPPTS
jgi:hypothetical protein